MLRGNEHTIAGAGDPPDRNPLMALTALFDGHFSIDWIVELTNLKISQVISILEDAVRQKKIVKLGSGLYSTQNQAEGHDPLKSFDTSKKRDYHNRIAGLLLRDLPDNEEKAMVLSHHLLQTSNDLDRCRYLVKAGDNNLKSFKTQKAFECHAKVLNDISALTGKEADQLFTETAIKYSKISIGRNDTSKVLGILREALFRAIRLKDKSRQALLEMHIAKNEWIMGKYSSAMSHFNKGWDLAAKQDDPNLRRSAITFNSFFLYWQGRYQEVVESYEKAVSDVEVFPKGQFPLLGTSTIGYCYTQVGQVTQGLGMIDAVRNICLKRGDLNLASFASGNLGCVMLDINRVDDAIEHLKMSAREAIEAGNKWVLLSAYLVLAYCYYKKGEKSHCAGYFCEFIKERKEIKMGVSLYSYLMDLLWVMEQGDLPKVRGWSLEQEIQQGIKKENLFIKGIAYRYKSLLGQKRGMSDDERIGLLNQSLEILKKTGHQLQIAETEMEIARLDLLLGKNAQAKKRMKTVSRKLSGYSETLIPNDLKSLLDKLPEKEKLFEEILEMGQKMATAAHDSDFTKKAISAINRMTGAERGALFLFSKKDRVPKLRLHASNNLTLSQVNHPNFSSSMKMLEEVARTGEACITGPDTDSDFFSEEHIRSRICVPMIHQKRVIGVFYNDNRLLSSAFKQSDLKLLSYFAAQAALTLDNARAYNEIKYLNEQLRQQNKVYSKETIKRPVSNDIIGESSAIKKVQDQIDQVAQTEATVLILGETGVGKELVAEAIHRQSSRKDKPFIKVHCSSLPINLISSELFGHERGAFTGAVDRRIGRFELANGGTLFLDEIGEIPHDIQVRLLRVLQSREFERVGGNQTLKSDFRLIAATNVDLLKEVNAGRFRADLFYRLNVFPVEVPPLKDRKEDIPLLLNHFLDVNTAKIGKQFRSVPESEMEKLIAYDWPGNIREMGNVIERGFILSEGPDLKIPELRTNSVRAEKENKEVSLQAVEKRHILWALNKTEWKVKGTGGAAELLEINASTLYFRMKKLGIQRVKNDS